MDKKQNVAINNEDYGSGFFNAFKSYWRNFFNFTGRSTRSEYWWMLVWELIFGAIIWGILYFVKAPTTMNPWALITSFTLYGLIGLILVIPYLALSVRRMNDVGFPLWFNLIVVLVGVGLQYNGDPSSPLSIINWVAFVFQIIIFIVSLMPSSDTKKF